MWAPSIASRIPSTMRRKSFSVMSGDHLIAQTERDRPAMCVDRLSHSKMAEAGPRRSGTASVGGMIRGFPQPMASLPVRGLVADDGLTTTTLLAATLQRLELEVTVVHDGAAAWEFLQSANGPWLGILDWMMPSL